MLVKIQKEVVQLGDVEGRHGWTVGGSQMSVEGDRVVIVVCPFFYLLQQRFSESIFVRVDLIIY